MHADQREQHEAAEPLHHQSIAFKDNRLALHLELEQKFFSGSLVDIMMKAVVMILANL